MPSGFPQRGSYGERETRLQGIFTSLCLLLFLSLRVQGKGSPTMFTTDRETLVTRATGPFIR